jgi:hypothetical protein
MTKKKIFIIIGIALGIIAIKNDKTKKAIRQSADNTGNAV